MQTNIAPTPSKPRITTSTAPIDRIQQADYEYCRDHRQAIENAEGSPWAVALQLLEIKAIQRHWYEHKADKLVNEIIRDSASPDADAQYASLLRETSSKLVEYQQAAAWRHLLQGALSTATNSKLVGGGSVAFLAFQVPLICLAKLKSYPSSMDWLIQLASNDEGVKQIMPQVCTLRTQGIASDFVECFTLASESSVSSNEKLRHKIAKFISDLLDVLETSIIARKDIIGINLHDALYGEPEDLVDKSKRYMRAYAINRSLFSLFKRTALRSQKIKLNGRALRAGKVNHRKESK